MMTDSEFFRFIIKHPRAERYVARLKARAQSRAWRIPEQHLADIESLEEEEIKKKVPHEESCGCPGWGVFVTNGDDHHIERCDDCKVFETDNAALAHVLGLLEKK